MDINSGGKLSKLYLKVLKCLFIGDDFILKSVLVKVVKMYDDGLVFKYIFDKFMFVFKEDYKNFY